MQEEEEGVLQTLAGAEQVTSASTGREPWRAAEGQALDEEAVQDAAEDEQQQAPPTGGSSGSTAAASPARQAAPPEPATSLTTTSSTGLEGDLSPDSIQVCAVNCTVKLRPVCTSQHARSYSATRCRCTALTSPPPPHCSAGRAVGAPRPVPQQVLAAAGAEPHRGAAPPVWAPHHRGKPASRGGCRRCAWRGDRAAETCTGADRRGPGCCTKTRTLALWQGSLTCTLHAPPVVPALLPRLQSLIDDFSCALKKRMLLQGRMYVFQEHACFHCNLFGYQKIKASSGCTAAPALRMQRMRCRVHWRADDSATRNAAGIRPGCNTGVGHGNLREWNSRAALLTALLTAPLCLCRRR